MVLFFVVILSSLIDAGLYYPQKMASNLTNQVRSISEVTKAVAHGNLSKIVDVDVQGEMLDLKLTVNMMVGQLSSLANEVIRMSIEVGTEGKLGGQAVVADVQGIWKVSLNTSSWTYCSLSSIIDSDR